MTEYTVRYLDDKKNPGSMTVIGTDVTHAISQLQEIFPDVHMTSVLPADQWTNEKNTTNDGSGSD